MNTAAAEVSPETAEPEPEPVKKKVNLLPIFLLLLFVMGGGGYYLYTKAIEKKKISQNSPDPDADYKDESMDDFFGEPEDEAEIEAEVKAIIAETGASSMKEMGKVMGVASKKMAGIADGRLISTLVKKLFV